VYAVTVQGKGIEARKQIGKMGRLERNLTTHQQGATENRRDSGGRTPLLTSTNSRPGGRMGEGGCGPSKKRRPGGDRRGGRGKGRKNVKDVNDKRGK